MFYLDLSRCISKPCKNGGTCLAQVNSYVCQCQQGYVGTNCQTGTNRSYLYTIVLNIGHLKLIEQFRKKFKKFGQKLISKTK